MGTSPEVAEGEGGERAKKVPARAGTQGPDVGVALSGTEAE